MPSRVVRGDINRSESLNQVSMEAELTFDRLITAVDDYGRLDARPMILKIELFPLRESATPTRVCGWVTELEIQGCVQRYESDGRPYLWLTGWEKHRGGGHRAERSKYPSPQGFEEPKTEGGVYFVRSGDGPVKIGFTQSFRQRLQHLRTSIPRMVVVAVIPDEGRAMEKRLHRQFAHLRVDREWFRAEPDLMDWIQANGQQWTLPTNARQRTDKIGIAHPTEKRETRSERREEECRRSSDASGADNFPDFPEDPKPAEAAIGDPVVPVDTQTQEVAADADLDSVDHVLAQLMVDRIRDQMPDSWKPPKNLKAWRRDLDLLHRVDKIPWKKIQRVFLWANYDTFWGRNILSPSKLRKHFARLEAQMIALDHGGGESLEDRIKIEAAALQWHQDHGEAHDEEISR